MLAKSEKREPGSPGLSVLLPCVASYEPTSKPKIVLDDMGPTFKTVTKTVSPGFVSFGVCCGRRFDLLGLVTAKMKTLPQSREIIVVTCTAGAAQSKNKKSTYFVCPGSIPVPALKKLKRGLRRHNSPQDDLKVFLRQEVRAGCSSEHGDRQLLPCGVVPRAWFRA